MVRPRSRNAAGFASYDDFTHLRFVRPAPQVLLITIDRPEVLDAANERLHREFSEVWRVVDRDDSVAVSVITGAGSAFSAGGDLAMVERMTTDYGTTLEQWRDARAAGDHAALLWPLLCGMARAKYYLMTADFVDGREAERIGLVTRCVPDDRVVPEALAIAGRLAAGSRTAVQWTKRVMNRWTLQAAPVYGSSNHAHCGPCTRSHVRRRQFQRLSNGILEVRGVGRGNMVTRWGSRRSGCR